MTRYSEIAQRAEDALYAKPLEEVGLMDAISAYFDLSVKSTFRQSDHPKKRVLPETSPERIAELRALSYDDYLETPEWRETSNRMKWSVERKCEECGRAYRLNVHHLTYERRGAELASDFLVLCHVCHMALHRAFADQDHR